MKNTNYLELDNLKNYEKPGVFDGSVHIAGTKGKGSTANFLSDILRQEGISNVERVLLGRNGEPVSAEALNSLSQFFSRVKDILDQSIELENGSISHFEAGFGGAHDATNVFSSLELLASFITTIGEEHLVALGGSLERLQRPSQESLNKPSQLCTFSHYIPSAH
ncbi:hypothetical protein C5167_027379 [Papaver somniferum]|nr:hypothetical protein C5167_027379 [Papaver somniferum]